LWTRERRSTLFLPAPSGQPEALVAALDGRWKVERSGGLLPPLYGVEKRIEGASGETRFGPVPFGFDVDGLRLRYRFPLNGFVDALQPDGQGAYRGRALFRGRELGRFRMIRRP
jgi:hypothetical protein